MKFFLLALLAALQFPQVSMAQAQLKSPNVSANALFLYRNSNFSNAEESTERNGVDLQEAEIAFYSEVDPYTRLNILLAIHPEYEVVGGRVEQEWAIEPEEAYADSNYVPSTLLKVGKFKAAFGKHNTLHTHAFAFVDAPVAQTALLGGEGLNDVGLSAAYLLPTSWFSEITAQYLKGEGENAEFNSPSPSDGVGVLHLKNLWDLSEEATLEFGLSHAQGNNYLRGSTKLNGADLTYKWRPSTGGKYHSVLLAGEVISRNMEQPTVDDEEDLGWNIWGQYQFAERWSGAVRYDQLDTKGADSTLNTENPLSNITTRKYSAALVFNATEFSSYRFEFNYGDGPIATNGDQIERKFYLQANFTIGAHPAHSY